MSTLEENREGSAAQNTASAFGEGLLIGSGMSATLIGTFVEIEPVSVKLALIIGGAVLAITTGVVTGTNHGRS